MCNSIICEDSFSIRCSPNPYQTRQMCDKIVDDCLPALKFIPDWFATQCIKNARIRSYSGLHSSGFGLNPEKYSVSLRILSECGKISTRITPNMDTQ